MHLEPYMFTDDAGKWEDKNFICLCAYLSDGQRWQEFTAEWNELLRTNGMSRLHMSEFRHEAIKAGWDDDKQRDVLLKLAAVVRKYTLFGFAVGLDAKHYRSLPKEKIAGIPKPNVACLQRILKMIKNRLRAEGYDGRITFVLDEEEGSAVGLYKGILSLRKSRRDLGAYIGAVCFADDTFYVPLQACDMFANLTYKWFDDIARGLASKDKPPEILEGLLLEHRIENELWTAEELDKGIAEMNSATSDEESSTFDAGVRKILSVSHDEVKRREEQWKQEREREGKMKPGPKPKTSPDARVSKTKV